MWKNEGYQFKNIRLPANFMTETIWFVTGNEGKFVEASLAFASLDIELKQFHPSSFEFIEPQHVDLLEISIAKLNQAVSHLRDIGEEPNVLVEDAGLFIDALNGFPGVYSSFTFDSIGLDGILRLLSHLTSENPIQLRSLRSASFQAVAMLQFKEKQYIGRGDCKGYISTMIKGEQGFGYDPLFIPNDVDLKGESLAPGESGIRSTHGATFGEISSDEKNEFSHRKKAILEILKNIDLG